MRSIFNPIIPGYYPDPSICRVGNDYYLVCSSFEFCPALPVFHSRDLANWEKICNAFSAERGLQVYAWSGVGGIMAPTIRYHNGTYYIINSNMNRGSNCATYAHNHKNKDTSGDHHSYQRCLFHLPIINSHISLLVDL